VIGAPRVIDAKAPIYGEFVAAGSLAASTTLRLVRWGRLQAGSSAAGQFVAPPLGRPSACRRQTGRF